MRRGLRGPEWAEARAREVLKGLPGQRVLAQNGANGHGERRDRSLCVRREAGADQTGGANGS